MTCGSRLIVLWSLHSVAFGFLGIVTYIDRLKSSGMKTLAYSWRLKSVFLPCPSIFCSSSALMLSGPGLFLFASSSKDALLSLIRIGGSSSN